MASRQICRHNGCMHWVLLIPAKSQGKKETLPNEFPNEQSSMICSDWGHANMLNDADNSRAIRCNQKRQSTKSA